MINSVQDKSLSVKTGAVGVQLLDVATVRKRGGNSASAGAVLQVPAGASSVSVTMDVRSFEESYGGQYGDRLRLFVAPECMAQDATDDACKIIALETVRDRVKGTITADVPVAAAAAGRVGSAPSTTPDEASTATARGSEATVDAGVTETSSAEGAAVDSVDAEPTAGSATDGGGGQPAAGPTGPTGDYRSASVASSGSWEVGLNSGSFQYSVPVPTAPSVAGDAPSMSLQYDSGSVDGRTTADNGQSSWLGEGWELEPGYIERKFHTCDVESSSSSIQDLCWGATRYFLHLGGRSSEMIPIPTTSFGSLEFRLRDDPKWKITQSSGAPNGVTGNGLNGEYFLVRAPDGAEYSFGYGQTQEITPEATNSVFAVSVFGDDSGEPCFGSASLTLSQRSCSWGWKFNLDRVVDAKTNAQTYLYEKETNYYNRYVAGKTPYDRGGYLKEIRYGHRIGGGELSQTPTARIVFRTLGRCTQSVQDPTAACPVLTAANAPESFPDTPLDLLCTAATCTVSAPTFWSARRLYEVEAQRLAPGTATTPGTVWHSVQKLTFKAGMPTPPDGASQLWLQAITKVGTRYGTVVSLPKVDFTGSPFDNRVDWNSSTTKMAHVRITQVTNELGGTLKVMYGHEPNRGCSATVISTLNPETNVLECFPRQWKPAGASPEQGWFHKYVVTRTLAEDPSTNAVLSSTGTPRMSEAVDTRYRYANPANEGGWHHDDDPSLPQDMQSYSDWRGYDEVTVNHIKVVDGVTDQGLLRQEKYRYFRGMHGDPMPGSTPAKSRTVDAGAFGQSTDQPWLWGRVATETQYNGTGSELSRTDRKYVAKLRVDVAADPAYTVRDAFAVAEAERRTRTTVGGTAGARTSTQTYSYSNGVTTAGARGLDDMNLLSVNDVATGLASTCTRV